MAGLRRLVIQQSVGSAKAKGAIDRLARDLGIAKSRVLEIILEAVETDDLLAMIRDGASLKARHQVLNLDVAQLELVMRAVSHSISLSCSALAESTRQGAREAVSASLPLVRGEVIRAAAIGARHGAKSAIESLESF